MNHSALTSTARARLVLAVCASLIAGPALAQRADSARVGVTPATATPAPRDTTVRGPPVSAKRAFLYSIALPGLGQARLGRPTAAAFFAGVELLSIALAQKSAGDLRLAKRYANDSIFVGYRYTCRNVAADAASGVPAGFGCVLPQGAAFDSTLVFNRYRGGRVGARRLHYEDWLAVIAFNHLISGADAFIAAQLWDLPTRVAVESREGGGAALAMRVTW